MSAVERGLAVVGACTLTIAAFVALACIVERVASLFRFHRPTTEVCRDGWHTAACEKATDARGVTAGVVAAIALDERNARRNRAAAKAYLPKPRPPWHDVYGTDD